MSTGAPCGLRRRRALVCRPTMASAASPAGVLGLLLMSALPGVLGDHPSLDLRAHPGTSEGCWGEAGTAQGSQVAALLTLLCPPPQGTPPKSALRPRNPGGGRRPRTSTSRLRRCLWGRCTRRLWWLLCYISACRCGKARGGEAPGLNFPWGRYGAKNRRHLPVCETNSSSLASRHYGVILSIHCLQRGNGCEGRVVSCK